MNDIESTEDDEWSHEFECVACERTVEVREGDDLPTGWELVNHSRGDVRCPEHALNPSEDERDGDPAMDEPGYDDGFD